LQVHWVQAKAGIEKQPFPKLSNPSLQLLRANASHLFQVSSTTSLSEEELHLLTPKKKPLWQKTLSIQLLRDIRYSTVSSAVTNSSLCFLTNWPLLAKGIPSYYLWL